MKVAVINFSGNVGKTTIAHHLLAPRISGAEVISIETINADDGRSSTLRASQFGELQEYLQTVDNVIVDIGASNLDELLSLMRKFRGSHKDFDYFVIPTVPALKQQQDTIATLAELARIGIPASKLRIVFNQVEDDTDLRRKFEPLLSFVRAHSFAHTSTQCRLGANEVYERVKGSQTSLADLAADETDYKAAIAKANDTAEKVALARKLATARLASYVVPELDDCFAALELS
jgi:cellulose biosynthesis protein BcsQ